MSSGNQIRWFRRPDGGKRRFHVASVPTGRGVRDPVDRLEIAIGTAFTVTIGSAVALVITYSRGGQTQLEGIFLGAALAGFAIGIGLWARHAMPGGGDVEEIEPLPSPADDRDAAAAEFERGVSLSFCQGGQAASRSGVGAGGW